MIDRSVDWYWLAGDDDDDKAAVVFSMTSDCPYGDRSENYCRKLQSRDCYDVKVQHACCDTCRSFRHHFSGDWVNNSHLFVCTDHNSFQCVSLAATPEISEREFFYHFHSSGAHFPTFSVFSGQLMARKCVLHPFICLYFFMTIRKFSENSSCGEIRTKFYQISMWFDLIW